MVLTGGCYCGQVRFEARGQVRMCGLCLCRTCQKISGGAGNVFIGMEENGFRYTHGEPQRFSHPDVADCPTREFCGVCGVHVAARSPKAPGGVIVKVGTLDDPALFKGPDIVVWTEEKHDFHIVPVGVRAFPRLPGAGV
jgi:hypothetical protein